MRKKSLALALTTSLLLVGCAQNNAEPGPTEEPFAGLTLVASTNVWGNIAKSIGGDQVRVVSIIENFAQDPHSYEASARDQLAVNDADLVIANGGGYDFFIEQLAQTAGKEVIFAYEPEELAEQDEMAEDSHDHDHNHDHSGGNEHVWYDFHVVDDFASRLAAKLASLDSANTNFYADNLAIFQNEIEILEDRTAMLSADIAGKKVISSEPVADYLLAELGLENITPKAFSQAIEEELDVSPKDLLAIQNLIKEKRVDLFVVNPQTGSVQIDALIELANSNRIPVVELSELLPEVISYFEWMDNNIASLAEGLA